MRSALLAIACLAVPRVAAAHGVFGDPDSGKTTWVLPGAVIGIGSTLGSRDVAIADSGLEVSVHRFQRNTGSLFSQLGYGALVQAQIAGAMSKAYADEAIGFRGALGVQGTYGLFGLQAGPLVRSSQGPFAGTAGVFTAAFLSLGIFSSGITADFPVIDLGGVGARMPVVLGWMLTGKWPLPFEDSPK